jgi:7,8-dihydro-6-hydroxymethylpterin-pyrophosphokinase
MMNHTRISPQPGDLEKIAAQAPANQLMQACILPQPQLENLAFVIWKLLEVANLQVAIGHAGEVISDGSR